MQRCLSREVNKEDIEYKLSNIPESFMPASWDESDDSASDVTNIGGLDIPTEVPELVGDVSADHATDEMRNREEKIKKERRGEEL